MRIDRLLLSMSKFKTFVLKSSVGCFRHNVRSLSNVVSLGAFSPPVFRRASNQLKEPDCGIFVKLVPPLLLESTHGWVWPKVNFYCEYDYSPVIKKWNLLIVLENLNKPGTAKVGAISKAQNFKGGPFGLCETPAGCKKFEKN